MDYDSDSSLGWTDASCDSESSNSVTQQMEYNNHESDNEENLVNSERKKHKKAKKRKRDEDSSVGDDIPAKKKHIKVEPDSDKDKSGEDTVARSESFDDLRIKQESADDTDEPRKKKKKKHKKSKEESSNESTIQNSTQENDTENGTSDMLSVEDSIRKKKKKKKSKHSESEDLSEETLNNDIDSQPHIENGKARKRNKVPSSTFIETDLNVTNDTINISAIPSTLPKKTKRISERLRFEDDEAPNTVENGYESDKDITLSKEVKKFLKRNPNLSPLSTFSPIKMDEEDIFILKCPTEVNIQDFKDANLVLDGKSKIKVAGQTYDGVITETDTKMPLVTYSKKSVFLKNLSILKTIVFNKRIPVPHIQDDSVITGNHTSFIPLPDTKCRHPLFGTDYKKAIKVPKVVRERLSQDHSQPEAVEQETLYKNKKKKHKKEKEKNEKESEVESSISNVKEEDASRKKKKKRKIKEETEAKPAKRIKLEQNPEAWESEKAIEENLFNF